MRTVSAAAVSGVFNNATLPSSSRPRTHACLQMQKVGVETKQAGERKGAKLSVLQKHSTSRRIVGH
ncbi:hypothetical protein ANO11243_075270 [Dothideomycetidae sp. 11243]|nr:hypothetical protein ANO11243_075270 [fungal sp. No.11243]